MYSPSTPRFLNPSQPLRAALAVLPGYDEYNTALDAIRRPLAAADAAEKQAQEAVQQKAVALAEALANATPAQAPTLIDSYTAEAIKAEDNLRSASAKLKLLHETEHQLGQRRDNIITAGSDHLLRQLDSSLKAAYKESWSLGLQGIHDAEEAIEAGKAEAWKTMLDLRAIVYQIRDAQLTIAAQVLSPDAFHRVRTWGVLANYAELFPGFLEGIKAGNTPPWPTQNDGTPTPDGLHAFILDHPDSAEPWVPTEAQLLNAAKTATAEARAAAHAAHVGQDA